MRSLFFGMVAVAGLASCVNQPSLRVSDTQNRVVDIVNTTDASLTFFALNAERRRAFRERFAEGVVEANYYKTINFSDDSGACMFDFFGISEEGHEATSRSFNTCAEVSWVITQETFQ